MLQRNQLALSDRILGSNHETTIFCVEGLSYILSQQEKYEQAESLLRQHLLTRHQSPEADLADIPDIGILIIMMELAHVVRSQKKYDGAVSLFKKSGSWMATGTWIQSPKDHGSAPLARQCL